MKIKLAVQPNGEKIFQRTIEIDTESKWEFFHPREKYLFHLEIAAKAIWLEMENEKEI